MGSSKNPVTDSYPYWKPYRFYSLSFYKLCDMLIHIFVHMCVFMYMCVYAPLSAPVLLAEVGSPGGGDCGSNNDREKEFSVRGGMFYGGAWC